MNDAGRKSLEARVLLLAPTVKDGELTREVLARAGIECVSCADQLQLCEQLTAGANAVLIAEEAVHGGDRGLAEWLARQPPWSDLPVLILARVGANSVAVARAMEDLGNVTVLERPTRVAALVSAVRTALRARQRQYQLRDQLIQREQFAEQLNMAMAAADAGSWQFNVTTGEFSASDRAIELRGLPLGTRLDYERALARIHSDDRASFEAALQRTLESGKPFRHEHRVHQPDGSVRWVCSHAKRRVEGGQTYVIGMVQDVTDRKETEAALQQSEERSAFVRRSSGVGFWYCDLPFDVLQWDELVKAHFHLSPDATVTIHTFYDRLHPEDREPTRQAIERSIAERTPYKVDYRTVDPDTGAVRWVRAIGRTFYAADGTPARFDGVTLDVSEQKHAEAELREGEQRMRLATEASKVGVWQWNVVTGQFRWDTQMFRIYGLAPTQDGWVPYSTWSERVFAEDLARQEEALQETVRCAGHSSREFRIRREGDGDCRVVESVETVRAGANGQVEWVLGTNLDITDRRRAEEALRDSEARLGGILRRSPAGIVQTDAAGCMTLVNPRWCEMLGYDEAELLGRNILEITHAPFVAPTAAALGRLAAGGPDFQIEKAYIRKDGSVLRAQSNVAALRSPDGEFLGLITVVLDISERLRAEEQLHRLAAELTEADRRKDVFLATLAHELRNPLAPIRNGLEVMKLTRNNGVALEQVRAMIERQLLQLVRLVDDLLDVSRFTQGKMELRKERIALKAVIEAAVETSRPVLEQAGHALDVVVPDEPVFVDGDATRLTQVVSNLLNNSAKYTHRGGHVRLTVWREDGTAVVSVKDDGIGIPRAMIGRVFEMFTQVDRTLEKTTGGLGIGLSLVKGLLEMHGGTIEAKSDGEGLGSEFVVRLPVVMDVVAGPDLANGQASEVASSALRRILVVDDNVDAADSLGQLLEMLGNEVRTANDGQAGVEVAAQFRPDVVLMDIGMPKLNGYEAARRIRQHPWGREMALVALTGWGQEDDRRKSADAGFDHHLVKPLEMDALMKLLSG